MTWVALFVGVAYWAGLVLLFASGGHEVLDRRLGFTRAYRRLSVAYRAVGDAARRVELEILDYCESFNREET